MSERALDGGGGGGGDGDGDDDELPILLFATGHVPRRPSGGVLTRASRRAGTPSGAHTSPSGGKSLPACLPGRRAAAYILPQVAQNSCCHRFSTHR